MGRTDHVRLERVRISGANLRIDAVGGNDQVGVGKFEVGLDLALEFQLDAQLLAALLQDIEQPLAADADEAVTGGAHPAALEQHLDIVPVVERGLDRRAVSASQARMLSIVASENTTPQPNVS